MTTEQLKCCPFCGGEAKVEEVEAAGYCIICTDSTCMASSNIRYACGDDPIPLLTEQWNRRTPVQLSTQTAVKAEQPSLSPKERGDICASCHTWADCIKAGECDHHGYSLLAQRQDSNNDAELRRVANELRAYSPEGDEYNGKYIHKVWAREIDAAIANGAPK